MQETLVRSLVGKIPLRRAWQPTPVLLPGESHGQTQLTSQFPGKHLENRAPSFWPGFLHASTKHLTPTCPALLPPFPHSYYQHLKTLSILSLPLYISHGIGFGETKKNKYAYLKSHELVKKFRAKIYPSRLDRRAVSLASPRDEA